MAEEALLARDEAGIVHRVKAIEIKNLPPLPVRHRWAAACGATGPWQGTFPTVDAFVMCIACMAAD